MTLYTPASDKGSAQLDAARDLLEHDTADFLHFPWPDLNNIVRGIAPGKLWLLAGYSGIGGKTTFLTNLGLQWAKQGTVVYYLPLETPPPEVWLRAACLELGIPVGDVLTGDCLAWPDWASIKERIRMQLAVWDVERMDGAFPFYVHPADRVDVSVVLEACGEASMLNADVLILDHVDHLSGDPMRGDYGTSVDVMRALDNARKVDPGLRLIIATQLNQDMVKGDPLAKILPPLESHIKGGGHKREVADGQLSLYRPMRRGVTIDQLKAVRRRESDAMLLVEPGTMGLEVSKHRARGDLTGRQCVLGVEQNGQIRHLPERDRYGTSYDDARGY